MASPLPRPATYEDLLKVPDHKVAELIDGELFVSPRPASPHAYTSSRIGGALDEFDGKGGQGRRGGWWIVFEPELHLGRDAVVPDLAGWRHERMPHYPDTAFFDLAPDWVCEVASPSTFRLDRMRKQGLYARAGVNYLWLVTPLDRLLEVYRREGQRWLLLGTHGGEEPVRIEPFETKELDLQRWWPPLGEAEAPPGDGPADQ